MKLRLVLTSALAALIVAFAGMSTQAVASGGGTASASKQEKNAKHAKKKAKKKCKSAKKAKKKAKKAKKKAKRARKKGSKKAHKLQRKAKKLHKKAKKAKKQCKKAKKQKKKANKKLKHYNAQFFDVCKHGCKYKTIQNGANAAGKWQQNNKNRKATVRVQPGNYVEGVLLNQNIDGRDYNGLTIMGVKKNLKPNPNPMQTVLDGVNAKTIQKGNSPAWQPGDPTEIPANDGIRGIDTTGLVLKNMYGHDYQANTFYVSGSTNPNDIGYCADFNMTNLVSSDTRSYGLFSKNCFGGKYINDEGWNHGDSALYVGETPCDDPNWTNHGQAPVACQKDPDWTIVKGLDAHQNVLGYSGTNSKYVKIEDSNFYNNGAGIVPNTLDSEYYEPNGWSIFQNNNVFWNNYNYYSTGSAFHTVSNGLGELAGETINYPIGIGIMLYGSDGIIARDNNVFGNAKWGVASFSAPVAGEIVGNEGDDAKNLNNQLIDNKLGRDGTDPNGTDFLNDNTGGGNCYQGNTPSPTYVPGNGSVPLDTIYPKSCPQPVALNDKTSSFAPGAGIQVNFGDLGDPATVLGYAGSTPPETMECSWGGITVMDHPAFTDANGKSYSPAGADPVSCP